jgi:Sulfotransferase family
LFSLSFLHIADVRVRCALFNSACLKWTNSFVARRSHPALSKGSIASGIPRQFLVIGMPRSGTTLIEKILASHPLGVGAGELKDAFWP